MQAAARRRARAGGAGPVKHVHARRVRQAAVDVDPTRLILSLLMIRACASASNVARVTVRSSQAAVMT
jgi:hypothetical protein